MLPKSRRLDKSEMENDLIEMTTAHRNDECDYARKIVLRPLLCTYIPGPPPAPRRALTLHRPKLSRNSPRPQILTTG